MAGTITEVVIPAAGLGTRMAAITGGSPKELLLIAGKPAIQYAIEEAYLGGIRDFYIVINREKEEIRRYIMYGEEIPGVSRNALSSLNKIKESTRFHFLYQERPTGEAEAILIGGRKTRGNAFGVIYPDNIAVPPGRMMRGLIRNFSTIGEEIIGLIEVRAETAPLMGDSGHLDTEPLEDDLYRVIRFLPKTKGKFKLRFPGELRSTGFSITKQESLPLIEKQLKKTSTGEVIDLHFREETLKLRPIYAWKMNGEVFDIGNPDGYQACKMYVEDNWMYIKGNQEASESL
ncbi:MAG: hypothetical protein D6726_06780 [Nitrospirae bacterium]|nr:MAG: hypothetical protein D6726_06780 [Nitrospirota bacterium]